MNYMPQTKELAEVLTREYQVRFSLYERRKPNTKTWDPQAWHDCRAGGPLRRTFRQLPIHVA